MNRTDVPAAFALVLALAANAPAQQPRVVGPTGPGSQPQLNTSPYAAPAGTPAARGVNPFAAPTFPVPPAGPRFAPRPVAGPPGAFAPPPGPAVVANNPAQFNPGVAVPFPVAAPPGGMPANAAAFNPLFVARPPVASAYYVPPLRSFGYPATDTPGTGTDPDPIPTFEYRPGEVRFLPWVW